MGQSYILIQKGDEVERIDLWDKKLGYAVDLDSDTVRIYEVGPGGKTYLCHQQYLVLMCLDNDQTR